MEPPEIEEVQQAGLRSIVRIQVLGAADETGLDKLENRRVIHRYVGNIMPPGEGEMTMFGSRKPSCASKP